MPGKSALEHRAQKRQQEKPPVTEKSEMLLLFYLSVPWEDQCEQGPAVPAGRGLRKVFWVREEPQQGSAGTPWSFTRVGGTARDRAAAPAEPPGPLLCPVGAAGASLAWQGLGGGTGTLLGPSQHWGHNCLFLFSWITRDPCSAELPLCCFLPWVLLSPRVEVSEMAHTECLVLISEELKVNLTPCILPDFTEALFILAELFPVRRGLVCGTKLSVGIKQIYFSTITFY